MDDIRRVLKAASWRMWVQSFLNALVVTSTVGFGLLLATRIVEKVMGYSKDVGPYWPRIFLWTGVGVLVIAVVWSWARRPKPLAVARTVDEAAALKESLSTALGVEKSPDPWAKAMIETAVAKARTVKVGLALPMQLPRRWPGVLATAAAFFLVWISLTDLDLSGRLKKKTAAEERNKEIIAVKQERAEDKKKLDELLAKAKIDLADAKGDENTGNTENKDHRELDPEAINRAAVKQLTDASERLAQLKENEKNAQAEAMREALKQLKQPQDGPLNEFSRSLARGDFNKAQQAMEQLSKQLAEGTLTPEQAAQAKAQMGELSKQLEKLSKNQDELTKQLEKKGLDQKTAQELAKKAMSGNKDELKKAMEELQNMSDQQKMELMKMAAGVAESMQQSGEMAQMMQKMAQGMTSEGMQQDGQEAMEQMGEKLSEMENLQSDMQNLDAALEEAKRQLEELGKSMCKGGKGMGQPGDEEAEGDRDQQGSWRQGDSRQRGKGSGGPGVGDGSSRPMEEADFQLEKQKANTQTTKGQVIGSRLVYGQQVKGESTAEFSEAVEAGMQAASEAMETQTVAREYHGPLKTYFGRLQAKVKADRPGQAATQAPAAKDAKDSEPKK